MAMTASTAASAWEVRSRTGRAVAEPRRSSTPEPSELPSEPPSESEPAELPSEPPSESEEPCDAEVSGPAIG